MSNRLWQKPKLHNDEDLSIERRANWLDLFYDLVFVIIIAELSHYLSSHTASEGILNFILLFIPLWWFWIVGNYYSERFETTDISFRLTTILQMLVVVVMAVFIHKGFKDGYVGIALAYCCGRFIHQILWIRAGIFVKPFRPVSIIFTFGFGSAIIIYLLSVFVFPQYRMALWITGLVIELITPMTSLSIQAKLPRLSTSKRPERFGLFVIIVLGETIFSVFRGIAESKVLTIQLMGIGFLGLLIVVTFWWIYFDFVAHKKTRRNVWWSLIWGYLHCPLLGGIAVTGSGLLHVLAKPDELTPNAGNLLIFAGVAIFLVCTGMIEITKEDQSKNKIISYISILIKILLGIFLFIIGFFIVSLKPIYLLMVSLIFLLIPIIFDLLTWKNRNK